MIEFKYLEDKKPKVIHEEMQLISGTSCPSYAMTKKLTRKFILGRESAEVGKSSGRSKDVYTPDVIRRIDQQVKHDQQIII